MNASSPDVRAGPRSRRVLKWMAAPVALLAVIAGRIVLADHGQCERQCVRTLGPSTTGARSWVHPDTCLCEHGTEEARLPRGNPPVGPDDPGTIVCGADGVTYPDKPAALLHTTPLHAGPCGACSNDADIATYRRTSSTLTGITEGCAFVNLVLGEAVGGACLRRRSGLSGACVDCWTENMSCTAAHCLSVCLQSRMRGDPRNLPNGKLNDCLACDEAYCGGPFIRCAGANRRRAGIVSDIQRPDQQLWREPPHP